MYEVLLFDLDGTLIASKAGITKSAQYALAACGIVVEDLDALVGFIGPSLYESFTTYYAMDDKTARFAVEKYRERYSTVGWLENDLYAGIPALLRAARAQGKTLAVATGKPEVFAKRILEHVSILESFSTVCGSTLDGQRDSKAAVIEEVLARLGVVDRSRVLMIGDRRHDVEGAKQCGIACCGVRFGYGAAQELETAGADYIVDTVEDLKHFLLPPATDTPPA